MPKYLTAKPHLHFRHGFWFADVNGMIGDNVKRPYMLAEMGESVNEACTFLLLRLRERNIQLRVNPALLKPDRSKPK